MPVREVTYYTVVCDGCGTDAFEGDEITAWSDIHGAEETALAFGWEKDGGRWTCDNCPSSERGKEASDSYVTLAFWECGHIEVDRGRSHACPLDVCGATYAAYAPVADEDVIRADERERLSARVYENGWCPTCGKKAVVT